jgi:hypothetical protein
VKHPVVLALILCLALTACSDESAPPQAPKTQGREASMNFDLTDLEPFFQRIAKQLHGFSPDNIRTVVTEASSLKVGGEQTWTFQVRHRGNPTEIRIRILMDDVNSPIVYFLTSEEFASVLRQEMETFAKERGK